MRPQSSTPTPHPKLHHLVQVDRLYAESSGARFYALRNRPHPGQAAVWTLASAREEFAPKTFDSVEACDAALDVWLAVQR